MPVPIEMAYNKADFIVYDCVYCYVVSPCYIVRRYTDYMKYDYGIEYDGFEVVFPRKYLGLHIHKNEEQILERNLGEVPEAPISISRSDMRRNYQNAVSLDYNMVTEDYEEALKECLKKNSQKVNRYGYGKIDWDLDFNLKEFSYEDYLTVIKDYQRELDNFEPKKQVKRKIKTPANK